VNEIREAAEEQPASLIRVENLSKHYIVMKTGSTRKIVIDAVRNISFELFANESLGLIGESGSGKTTTANMIMKMIQPSEGRIHLFGKDITDIDESRMRPLRKDIQIIFQHARSAMDPHMTIGELLREPLKIHHIVPEKRIDAEVNRLLALVGLTPAEKHKFPSQLSGGQNQRILIARAIATRPRVIVCDEPVSALDVSVQGQILNLLKKLKQELNLTYLFITHDLKVVRFMCERIAVMYEGEIIETGRTDAVVQQPRHQHTRELTAAVLQLPG